MTLRKKIDDVFRLDLRSLALFRIALGAGLLYDLALRVPSLKAFYTDAGLLPRTLWLHENANPWIWSFHLMGGTAFSQALLFLVAALLACGLLVGYRTRWMTFFSWLMLISLHNRLPSIQNSGDVYLRLSLLWSLFLPLGACASVDHARQPAEHPEAVTLYGWGAFALLMQTCLMYWTTAAYKFQGHDWWGTGSAVYYVLNLEIFATHAAHALLMFPRLLTPLTYSVIFYEAIGPFLLLSPFRTARLRTLALVGFLFLHVSFALCLNVAPFSRLSILELLPFIPGEVWDRWSLFHLKDRLRTVPLSWGGLGILAGALFSIGAYGTLFNFHSPRLPLPPLPKTLNRFSDAIHLDQAWNIFAPEIARRSGWWVIPGRLKNGREVDVYQGGATLSWAPPALVSDQFPSERWRRYSAGLMGGRREGFVEYSQYLCRSWNESHSGEEQLQSMSIFLMTHIALPNDEVEVSHRVLMWRARCIAEATGLP